MGFWDHIDSKSSATKAQYALAVSGIITGIIAVVWMSTVPARFSESLPQNESNEGQGEFTDFLDQTKDQFGSIIDGMNIQEESETPSQAGTMNMDSLSTGAPTSERELFGTSPSQDAGTSESSSNTSLQNLGNAEPETTSHGNGGKTETNTESPRVIMIATSTSAE